MKIIRWFKSLLPQRGAKRIPKEEMKRKLQDMEERIELSRKRKSQ